MTNSARVMFGYHLEGLTLHFDFKNASRKLSSPLQDSKASVVPRSYGKSGELRD